MINKPHLQIYLLSNSCVTSLSLLLFLWEMGNKSHMLLAVKTKHCSTNVLGTHQNFLFLFSPRPLSRDFCGEKYIVRLMSSAQLCKLQNIHSSRGSAFPHFPGFNPTQQRHFQWSCNMSTTRPDFNTKDAFAEPLLLSRLNENLQF